MPSQSFEGMRRSPARFGLRFSGCADNIISAVSFFYLEFLSDLNSIKKQS